MRSPRLGTRRLPWLLLLATPLAAQSEPGPSFEWKQCDEDVLACYDRLRERR